MTWRVRIRVTVSALLVLAAAVLAAAFLYPHVRRVAYVDEHLVLDQRLMIPPLLPYRIENGEKAFELVARKGNARLVPQGEANTAGFNGPYLGPTIRAQQGDRIRINVANDLGEPTTVHWHGMHLPAAMDGGPHQEIAPGDTWSPHWTVTNEAATLWYHPHTMGRTAGQVYSGLAGLFLIDDVHSRGLALPKTYSVDDTHWLSRTGISTVMAS